MTTKRSPTRRLVRYLIFGVLNLLLLLVVVALAAPLLFDPNDYKDTIAEQVKARTGRDVTIVGDMRFSVLPWLGVSVGEIRLANAAGADAAADGKPFAQLDGADLRVKLIPLLSREVQMDTISVRGLELRLSRDANGRGNWEDLAAAGASDGDGKPAASAGDGVALAAFALGGVHIEDAAVTYTDARSNETISLTNVDLRTGAVSIGAPVDVQLSLRYALPQAVGKATGKARLSYDLSSRRIEASELDLSTEAESPALGQGIASAQIRGAVSYDDATGHVIGKALVFALNAPMPKDGALQGSLELSGAGDLDVRIAEQTLSSPDLQITIVNLKHGTTGISLQANSSVAANLANRNIALTGLRGEAQVSGPPIQDATLPIAFSGDVTADLPADRVQIANLKLSAEGLALAGDVSGEAITSKPVFIGTLAAPAFKLDALLARVGVTLPATRDPNALKSVAFNTGFKFDGKQLSLAPLNLELDGIALKGKFAASTNGALAFDLSTDRLDVDRYMPAATKGAAPPAAAGALPVAALRGLNIDGSLKVGALRYAGLDLSKVSLGIAAKDSQLRLSPLQADLYGGQYKGDIRIDARKDLPVMHLNEQITNLDVDALLTVLKVSTGALDLRGGRSSLGLKTTVTTDTTGKTVHAADIVLDGQIAGRAFKGGAVPVKLRGDVVVDLGAQRASARKASAQFAELNVAGDLDTSFAPGALKYDGALDLAPFNARALAARLGIPLPRTGDSKALTSIGGKATISGNAHSVTATGVAMKLDDSAITGEIAVLDFASLALRFNVDVNTINVDDYLPPSAKGQAATPGAAATALPVDLVRSLNIDGQLRIGKLTISGMQMSKVVVTANAKDGLLKLSPLGAVLYQGRYDGNVTMDARASAPKISLDETIKGVQIGDLLKDVRGDSPVTGATDLRAVLTAIGGDTGSLKHTVDGNVSFAIRNGTLEKVDMVDSMCGALAAIDFDNLNKKTIAAGVIGLLLNSAKPKPTPGAAGGSGGNRTEFTEMTGTAVIAKGIARNDDLAMSSPIVKVRGAGTIDLPADQLNYRAEAELVQSCAGIGQRDLAGQIIPVVVTGPIGDPNVQPQIPIGLINALRNRRPPAQAAPPPVATQPGILPAPAPPAEQAAPAPPAEQAAPAPAEQPAPSAKEQRKEALKGLLKGLLK